MDICTEKKIKPWEVSFIYMANSAKPGILDDFLGYVSAMRRIQPIADFNDDISVAMTTLYCGLKQSSVNSNGKCLCDCGGARKGSHLLIWQWKSYIDDVIDWFLNVNSGQSGILHRVLQLCITHG